MKPNERAVKEAISDGWYAWISDHPITAGDTMELAIKAAWKEWLEDHTEEILKAIREGGEMMRHLISDT